MYIQCTLDWKVHVDRRWTFFAYVHFDDGIFGPACLLLPLHSICISTPSTRVMSSPIPLPNKTREKQLSVLSHIALPLPFSLACSLIKEDSAESQQMDVLPISFAHLLIIPSGDISLAFRLQHFLQYSSIFGYFYVVIYCTYSQVYS